MLNLALLLQEAPNSQAIQQMAVAILAILPLLMVVGLAVIIVPFWFICKKAGFSPWLSLLNIVPFGSLVLVYLLAFAEWKVVPVPQTPWQPPMAPPTLPPQI